MGIVIRMSRPRTRPFIARGVKGGRPVVVNQKGGLQLPPWSIPEIAAKLLPGLIKIKRKLTPLQMIGMMRR